MLERIVKRSRGFSPNLYFDLDFDMKKKSGMRRGTKIKCTLKKVMDPDGNVIKELEEKMECEVRQRDGRFYIPPELIQKLNLFGGEYYELLIEV
jgi:hypothetical protein